MAEDEIGQLAEALKQENVLVLLDHDPTRFRTFLEKIHAQGRPIVVVWYDQGNRSDDQKKALEQWKNSSTNLSYFKVDAADEEATTEFWRQYVLAFLQEKEDSGGGVKKIELISDFTLLVGRPQDTIPDLIEAVPESKNRVFVVTTAVDQFANRTKQSVGNACWLGYEYVRDANDNIIVDDVSSKNKVDDLRIPTAGLFSERKSVEEASLVLPHP